MVPTELLAEQHFATSIKLLSNAPELEHQDNLIKTKISPDSIPISIGLITGSTKKSIRTKLQDLANSGSLDIIIGTQSLIQDTINVPNLALAIVDEQQRFGVMQRSELRAKGMTTPHLLAMSATPIPRTLALTLFGDLDISTIDELPPGRQEVLTKWVPHGKRDAAHGFIRDQINSGRQAFIIFPLVEESETIESGSAIEGFDHLQGKIFPDLCLGLLHGRMKAKEKESVMNLFQQGKIDILVSTPVVEVGIDIPNATVMLIETADRFGLSQLHQFRGRVGRGIHKSYCLLLSDNPSTNARERLSAMETVHDGFKLAEVDLGLRGPGDLFGTRQSGLPNLRLARLTDQDLLILAREEASTILATDPTLTNETNSLLSKEVHRFKGDLTGAVG
jgi:ATP-dependent DNA helicase RecG